MKFDWHGYDTPFVRLPNFEDISRSYLHAILSSWWPQPKDHYNAFFTSYAQVQEGKAPVGLEEGAKGEKPEASDSDQAVRGEGREEEQGQVSSQEEEKMNDFQSELETLINKHSLEGGSDTLDFILAQYLRDCLEVYNKTLQAREKWYSRPIKPPQ